MAAPQLIKQANKEVLIPIAVQGIANKDVIAYEFDLRYDPSVMQPVGDGVDRVVVYGAMPIDMDGVLLNLRFLAVGADGSVSALLFERIMFNEGESRVTVVDGRIELF